ncbi:DUF4850 domain-containing protein [Paenibacillus mucilaginosus]|nr:DUF4850 domain-containing protein [Paenibacillus mucilaginosus]
MRFTAARLVTLCGPLSSSKHLESRSDHMPTSRLPSRPFRTAWALVCACTLLLASCEPGGGPSADPKAANPSAAASVEPARTPQAGQPAEAPVQLSTGGGSADAPPPSASPAAAPPSPASSQDNAPSPADANGQPSAASGSAAHNPAAASAPPVPEPPPPAAAGQRPPGKQPRTEKSGRAAFEPAGAAKFEVPVVCVQADYGADPEGITLCPPAPLSFKKYKLTAHEASRMAVYWMSTGYGRGISVLAPGSWAVHDAVMGANGSVSFMLQHPNDPEQRIVYSDSGACQGCVIANIGGFFPGMEAWAEQQGFPVEPVRDFARRIPIGLDLLSYSLKISKTGYEAHGVASKEQPFYQFRLLEVNVKNGSRPLATAALNFFADTERQRIPQPMSP